MIDKNGIFCFPQFQPSGLIYGISSKKIGDLRTNAPIRSLKNFCKTLKISSDAIVRPEQIHGNFVKIVTNKDKGKIISKTDGLVTTTKGVYLMVVTADCVPLLFYDPVKKIIGIAHAGWKGASQKIASKMISHFQKLDSKNENIFVLMGPAICQKHYRVGKEVLEKFKGQNSDQLVFVKDNNYYLDLKMANFEQLIKSGVKKDHIFVSNLCTFEGNDNFYSWRREKPNLSGEFATVIGLV